MPDLGKYTAEVLAAYGISITLVAGLIWVSWRRFRTTARAMQEVERRHG
ncbi:MAG: heme exporter protein CcmD [Rhodobacterales bacterium]|nr:MAG: heme exporter protein CcmD [Rhodobacterales bacterium]